jgi:hypothetical protein
MTKCFDFVSVNDKMPPCDTPVLLKYKKGKKARWNGQTGVFYTQGYYHEDSPTWMGGDVRRIWFDYTDRQLQDLAATTSKNEVIEWAYLP